MVIIVSRAWALKPVIIVRTLPTHTHGQSRLCAHAALPSLSTFTGTSAAALRPRALLPLLLLLLLLLVVARRG
jgi:hypothetical protein